MAEGDSLASQGEEYAALRAPLRDSRLDIIDMEAWAIL